MNRIRAAWRAFLYPELEQQIFDLEIARVGIRDLKNQLSNGPLGPDGLPMARDYEAEARAASDMIAEAALKAMGKQR